jgi:hypothetical protein
VSVPRLDLDTLTWADLVALGRERLASESTGRQGGPRWTLHGPVDPGVTLLELLAWQLEQRLYMLNQEPDELVRNVIELLGVEPPAAARPAVTVLSLEPAGTRPVALSAGSVIEPEGVPLAPPLATDHRVTLVPGLRVDAVESPLAGALGHAGGDDITDILVITLHHGVSGPPPDTFSLFLDVEPARLPRGDQGLDDEWLEPVGWETAREPPRFVVLDPSGVEREPIDAPAELAWHAAAANQADVALVHDGTGGLRHSGVVTVSLPPPVAGSWMPTSRLRLAARARVADFSFPPLVRGVYANAVVARNEIPYVLEGPQADALVADWLRLPGQVMLIDGAAGRLFDDVESVKLTMTESDGETFDWRAAPSLLAVGPGERVFTIDRAAGALRFGDGRHGRIPALASDPEVHLRYSLGGGDIEGVAAGQHWRTAPRDDGVFGEGQNLLPLGCGAGSETLAAARVRASQDVQRNIRLVTRGDHVELALSTPGVDLVRAAVVPRLDLANACARPPDAVTVVCVPRAPRGSGLARRARIAAPHLDHGAARAIRRRFADGRLIGSFVHITGPRYRTVHLRVEIGQNAALPDDVVADIRLALVRFLDPVEGDADGEGWRVGRPLAPADLLSQAQAAAGPAVDVLAVTVRLDDGAEESCDPIPLGPLDLPSIAAEQVEIRTRTVAT